MVWVAVLLAVEIALRSCNLRALAFFPSLPKLLLAQASIKVPSTEKCSSDSSTLPATGSAGPTGVWRRCRPPTGGRPEQQRAQRLFRLDRRTAGLHAEVDGRHHRNTDAATAGRFIALKVARVSPVPSTVGMLPGGIKRTGTAVSPMRPATADVARCSYSGPAPQRSAHPLTYII